MARESKPAIKCKWAAENKFLVQPDGQVVPCCYLANAMYPLDESYDKPVTAMSQLMGTRAEIVRRLNSFHVSKGINFSMGGYLGLPLSEHRWIDEVKFKLGWMIGHVL